MNTEMMTLTEKVDLLFDKIYLKYYFVKYKYQHNLHFIFIVLWRSFSNHKLDIRLQKQHRRKKIITSETPGICYSILLDTTTSADITLLPN